MTLFQAYQIGAWLEMELSWVIWLAGGTLVGEMWGRGAALAALGAARHFTVDDAGCSAPVAAYTEGLRRHGNAIVQLWLSLEDRIQTGRKVKEYVFNSTKMGRNGYFVNVV